MVIFLFICSKVQRRTTLEDLQKYETLSFFLNNDILNSNYIQNQL